MEVPDGGIARGGGGGGGGLRVLEHPLSQKRKKKKDRLGISIIGNILVRYTQHKNRYLHLNICLGFLNKSNYFVKSLLHNRATALLDV